MVSASPVLCPESMLRSRLFYTKNRPAASFFDIPGLEKIHWLVFFEVIESTDKDYIAFFECCIVCTFLQTVQIHVGLIVPGALAEGKIRDCLHLEALARRLTMRSIRQRRGRSHARSAAL